MCLYMGDIIQCIQSTCVETQKQHTQQLPQYFEADKFELLLVIVVYAHTRVRFE
jgi:hypothetical protein